MGSSGNSLATESQMLTASHAAPGEFKLSKMSLANATLGMDTTLQIWLPRFLKMVTR